MVLVNPARARAVAAVPLPGRPTDLVAAGRTLWTATVDSASLTSIDSRTRKILRSVPLRGRPDALAVGAGAVWVADGLHGVLAQVRPGYATVVRSVGFPRAAAPAASAESLQLPRATLAATRDRVWLTNRSRRIFWFDAATGERHELDARMRVDAVAAGAGAVWALAPATATVLRLDAETGRITDRVRIVARRGPDLPAPTAIAAGREAVWVLNANSATATRINPRSLGVEMTSELGIDRVPTDIAATGNGAWIANFDGSLSHLEGRSSTPRNIWVGGSLERVAVTASNVWTTTTALDQKLPGGSG
jgi:hypothetical protein